MVILNQLKLAEDSNKVTAIITPLGCRSVSRMSVWYINCARAVCSKKGPQKFKRLFFNGVIVNVDDTVIYRRNVENS